MTSINKLTKNPAINPDDLLVIWDAENQRTRSVSYNTLKDAVPNLKSAEYISPNLVLTQSNGDKITVEISDSVDIIDPSVKDNELVIWDKDTGKFISAGATKDPITGEISFDKTISVPAGSINVGEAATLSEGGEDLLVLGNITNKRGFALTADFNESGSMAPNYINLGAQFSNILQGIDTDSTTENPLEFAIVGGVISPNVRQTNQVTFRTSAPMKNVAARITDTASGTVIRYVPNKAAWDAVTPEDHSVNPGLDFIAGDNIVDFISQAPSTAGVFNIGVVPFRLSAGQQIDVEFKADTMSLLGVQSGPNFFPYLTQLIQEGSNLNLVTQNELDASVALLQTIDEKGVALGYASLGPDGKVPIGELPAVVQGGIKVIGFWDTDTNNPDLSALTPDQGSAYQVSVAGSTNLNGETNWAVKDLAVFDTNLAGNWFKLDNTDDVLSVNGKAGIVTLDAADVGALASVTSDASLDGAGTVGDPLKVAVDNVSVAQHRKMYGFDIHRDDTTSGTAYTAPDGVKTLIPNNGALVIQDLDPSITDLVTPTGGAILDQVNAIYSIGIQFTAKPATRDKDYYILFEIPDGISPGVDMLIAKRFIRFAKNLKEETISMSFVIPCTPTIVNKDILPYIETDGTACDFWETNITVTKINGPVIP